MNRCQAETYCKQFNEQKSNCHEYCIGYVQLQNLYQKSSMPLKYQFEADNPLMPAEVDLQAFRELKKWKDNVQDHIEKGKGLFLYSRNKGNGKTTWATKMMNEYFKKVAITNPLHCRGLFIEVPLFFKMLRDNMNNPSDEIATLDKLLRKVDLVIWDDIGAENPTKYVRETFYTYINHREGNLKSQIFTSNLLLEELMSEDSLGERIVSRIKGSCQSFEFFGGDRR